MKQKTKFKQTEIGMVPEDWEVEELGSLLKNKGYIRGPFGSALRRPELKKEGIPVYEQEHAIYNRRKFRYFIDDKKFQKLLRFTVEENDLIVSCSGTFGKVSIIKKEDPKGIISQALLILRPDTNKINPNYLKFFFTSRQGFNAIASRSLGSVQVNIAKRSVIEKIDLPVPPIQEQKAIASILSSLDAKIELNNKMNKTLEAIGQAIFKKWFVDFEFPDKNGKPHRSSGGKMTESELGLIPAGWKVGKLGDIIGNIKEPFKSGENLKDRKYVPIDYLSMRKIGLDSFLPYTEAKSGLVGFEKNDILLGAMRVYFHRVNLSPFSGVTRTTTFVLRPKIKENLSYCIFLLNKDETINFANTHSKGSTMPYAVWNNSLEDMLILIPSENILKEFNNIILPMLIKIRDTIFQNQTLSQIRDTLLPKLMSGEVRVPL